MYLVCMRFIVFWIELLLLRNIKVYVFMDFRYIVKLFIFLIGGISRG